MCNKIQSDAIYAPWSAILRTLTARKWPASPSHLQAVKGCFPLSLQFSYSEINNGEKSLVYFIGDQKKSLNWSSRQLYV